MYERDEQQNHPNIIKIGDKRPKNLKNHTNSTRHTINLSGHQRTSNSVLTFQNHGGNLISVVNWLFALANCVCLLQIWTCIYLCYNCVHFTNCIFLYFPYPFQKLSFINIRNFLQSFEKEIQFKIIAQQLKNSKEGFRKRTSSILNWTKLCLVILQNHVYETL